jgi:hypothetical protein
MNYNEAKLSLLQCYMTMYLQPFSAVWYNLSLSLPLSLFLLSNILYSDLLSECDKPEFYSCFVILFWGGKESSLLHWLVL